MTHPARRKPEPVTTATRANPNPVMIGAAVMMTESGARAESV
jgi:hypothetical protein